MAHSVSANKQAESLLIPILIYLLAGFFLAYEMALQVFPGIIASQITANTNISLSLMGWIAGVYFISYTSMQIPAGIAFDFMSVKRILIAACLLCALGVYLFSFFNMFYLMMLGRFLIGFGSSFAFTSVLIVANQYFDKSYYPLLVGVAQLLGGFGAWGGEAPLAFLVDAVGVVKAQQILYITGLVLAFLSWIIIPNETKDINYERLQVFRSDVKKTISNPQTLANASYAFFKWAPVIIIGGTWGVPFLEKALNVSVTNAAHFVGWIWISMAVSSPFWGWLSTKMSSCRKPMIIGSLVGIVVSIAFILFPHINTSICLFLLGTASASHLLTFVLVKHNNPEEVVGTALGLNNMAVVAGGIFFNPLIGYMIDYFTQSSVPSLVEYQYALMMCPACYVIALVICLRYIRDASPC